MPDRFDRPTSAERRSAALYRLATIADPVISPRANLTGLASAVRICRRSGCEWVDMAECSGLTEKRLKELEET